MIQRTNNLGIVNFGVDCGFEAKILQALDATALNVEYHRFPDGESYVRVVTRQSGEGKLAMPSRVIVLANLYRPDEKMLQLYFLCETLRELGVRQLELLAPYLPYMRQDIQFKPGEAVTSRYFAKWLSQYIDRLITVDPHLHRYRALSDIYTIDTDLVCSSDMIAEWIVEHIKEPVLIGPDFESEQWVTAVANKACCPFIILEKKRRGDRDVEVSVPDSALYKNRNPILVDDIISTGKTMLKTAEHLQAAGFKKTVCIGVHAVCAQEDYQQLLEGHVEAVITCNTVPHESNQIDLISSILKVL